MRWDSEHVFTNSANYFNALIEACDEALYSIDMEFYIFESDSIGDAVCAALARAVKRGVAVRLLVDGFGSARWIYSGMPKLRKQGVEVRIYHPLPVFLFPGMLWNSLLVFRWLPYLLRFNQRNHRKFCILDGKTAFVGSQNIVYTRGSGLSRGLWRETAVRIQGEAVSELLAANRRAVKLSWGFSRPLLPSPFPLKKKQERVSGLVRINDTLKKRALLRADLVNRILASQHRVWITTAYFVPSGTMLKALGEAAKRGIDVRLLLPGKSDVSFIPWVSAALSFGLLKAGVKIFEYQANILHAKTLLVDDWATVGSSNLNHRSLLHDLECDIVLKEENSLKALEQAFETDLLQSVLLTMEDWLNKPWYTRLIGRFALVFKTWM